MAQIGYIRVSSNSQNTDRQLDGMKLDKTFTEKQSGKSANDRLARNLADLQAIVEKLNAKGVAVHFQKENLTFVADGSNPMNKLMFQMLGAFAEFERSIIKERQREGIDKALENGVKFGAKPKFSSEQIEQIKVKHIEGVSVANIAKEFETSRQTIYTMLAK